jgi:hypothetical protein
MTWMVRWQVSDEFQRRCKGAIVSQSRLHRNSCLENLSKNTRRPVRIANVVAELWTVPFRNTSSVLLLHQLAIRLRDGLAKVKCFMFLNTNTQYSWRYHAICNETIHLSAKTCGQSRTRNRKLQYAVMYTYNGQVWDSSKEVLKYNDLFFFRAVIKDISKDMKTKP